MEKQTHRHETRTLRLIDRIYWPITTQTLHVKVLIILDSVTGSGTWYQISVPLVQLMTGTRNWTVLLTREHSCQVTGSQSSLPAHTYVEHELNDTKFTIAGN